MTTTIQDMTELDQVVLGNDLLLGFARRSAVEAARDLVRYLRTRADDIERDAFRASGTDGATEHGTSEADLWRWIVDAAGAPVSNSGSLRNLELAQRDIEKALVVRRTVERLKGQGA